MQSANRGTEQRCECLAVEGPHRPINTLADRAAVIAALASVDAVISFEDDTPRELITCLNSNPTC
jgi:bifunctional ADP-heptose synthase (sugar kinase/adenylyltransferase)